MYCGYSLVPTEAFNGYDIIKEGHLELFIHILNMINSLNLSVVMCLKYAIWT